MRMAFLAGCSEGMPSPRFLVLGLHSFHGQKDFFVKEYTSMSVYQIFRTLQDRPGGWVETTGVLSAGYEAGICDVYGDRPLPNPKTGQRSHVRYFRVLQTMDLAKSRRDVSTFYFDSLFLSSLRSGISNVWTLTSACILTGRRSLARFLYGHVIKRIGEISLSSQPSWLLA